MLTDGGESSMGVRLPAARGLLFVIWIFFLTSAAMIAPTNAKQGDPTSLIPPLLNRMKNLLNDSFTLFIGGFILLQLLLSITLLLWLQRRRTRAKLEACGLPIVFWRPRFVNYLPQDMENNNFYDQKLPSSNITNILPRMERLKGPYGMYGTVYGISTMIVHVAHPTPATTILSSVTAGGATTISSKHQQQSGKSNQKQCRKSSIASSCGATKAPAYNHFKNFCGEGVFTAEGDDWREKRAAVMHALLRGPTNGYEDKVEREAHRAGYKLVAFLDSAIQCASAEDDGEAAAAIHANVVPLLQRTTIGLIYRYITHCDLENDGLGSAASLGRGVYGDTVGSSHFHEETSQDVECRKDLLSHYLKSIMRIRMIILAQSRSIWFLLPRWVYRAFSSMYREEERTMGPIREFSTQACHRATLDSPLAALQRVPVYANNSNTSPSSKDQMPFSKNIIDEAITLLFAGQDTSAATLSWTLHLLSLYPAIQSKLALELRTVLPNIDCDTVLTKKMLSGCSYLDAVIKESMRLYPVAPFVVRKLPFPIPIKSSSESGQPSTVLPADSLACIWIYSLHRNPRFWRDPDDFVPERWHVEDGDDIDPKKQRDEGITNGAYLPFALGPRNCVGQPLAHIILRSLLARLIHGFEFRDDRLVGNVSTKELRKEMQAGFTVLPQGGVHLTIQRRRQGEEPP